MIVRSPVELGAVIRDQRKARGLGQQQLARLVGVSRQWIIEVEKGKPRAEIGLLLRTLDALGVELAAQAHEESAKKSKTAINLDAIVESSRRKR